MNQLYRRFEYTATQMESRFGDNMGEVAKVLDFVMGKNTPARRDFIVANLATDLI